MLLFLILTDRLVRFKCLFMAIRMPTSGFADSNKKRCQPQLKKNFNSSLSVWSCWTISLGIRVTAIVTLSSICLLFTPFIYSRPG